MKKEIIITLSLLYPTIIFGQQPELLKHNNIAIIELTTLNSSARETNLSISPDGKYLYFMSDQGKQPWSIPYGEYNGKQRFDGDIWFSEKKDFVWQKPICLDRNVNTSAGEDEPNISPDGQFLLFQSWKSTWQFTRGPYYEAELINNKWNITAGAGGGIHEFFMKRSVEYRAYATDGASLSPDRKTFIVACGQFYEGNMNLFISKKQNNQWQAMKKMEISTPGDERSVFIAGDGKTIFFASDSYTPNFGGLDIYKATLLPNGKCTDIQNIGEPFNTANDDYGFILTASGREAYFIREGNIFYADLLNADPRIKPKPTVLISGTVADKTSKFVETKLELTYNDSIIATSKSNAKTGKYLFVVDKQFTEVVIRDKEQKYINTKIELKGNESISVDIKKLALKNWAITVNFDSNSSQIKSSYKLKLDALSKQLSKAKSYNIELIGQTDSKGSVAYNEKLALQRAKSVKQYLAKKGLRPEQIKISGTKKKTTTTRSTKLIINATY